MSDSIVDVQVYGSGLFGQGSGITLDLRCVVAAWPAAAGRIGAVIQGWPAAETVELLPLQGQREALLERWKAARRTG